MPLNSPDMRAKRAEENVHARKANEAAKIRIASKPEPVKIDPRVIESARALRILGETDFVLIKALELNHKISDAWKAWRQTLRDIVNGSGDDVPPEPPRYTK